MQTVTVNLGPMIPGLYQSGSEALFQFDLASLIVDVCRDLQKGLRDSPSIESESLRMEILFGVQQTIGGAGSIKLFVLEFEGGTQTEEGVQLLTLRFQRLRPP